MKITDKIRDFIIWLAYIGLLKWYGVEVKDQKAMKYLSKYKWHWYYWLLCPFALQSSIMAGMAMWLLRIKVTG